jgi:dTDP-4-dehydrorhamnose 3,5-epimerase
VRAVILGAGGRLGRALCAALPTADPLTRADFDLAAPTRLDWSAYDTVINAAAYTKVDQAEQDRAAVWAANATGPANLARIALEHDLRLVHISTDCVFDGTHPGPIPETCPMAPLSAYGAAKAAGDTAVALVPNHWIIRPSWVIGAGASFARTMLGLAERGIAPIVVADQVGRPTLAGDLAAGIVALLDAAPGTYHLTNPGDALSWADLARFVLEQAGHDPGMVTAVTSAEYYADKPGSATRPPNSVLDLTKATEAGVALPDWRESLAAHLATPFTTPPISPPRGPGR